MKFSISICVCLCVLFVTSAVMADPGPPDPISIDRASPSVVGFGETPGNIYDMLMPGDPRFALGWDTGAAAVGMVVHEPDINYGLQPLQDNNDGHSNGEADPWESPLLIYFSGDDSSLGMPMITDYDHQAMRMQAAGDRFVTNGPTTVSPAMTMYGGGPSTIAGPVIPGGMGNYPINLLSANQHRYNEIPSIGPLAFNGYVSPVGAAPMDDMDALELTPFDLNGDRFHDTAIYFSLDAISPSLGASGSGADIMVTPPGFTSPLLFAPAPTLGLVPNDEIDALAVWDTDNTDGQPAIAGADFALFSLAPGSPFLSAGMSAADIFVTDFSGINMLYLPAQALGMLPTDNIDALDVEIWVGDPAWLEEELLDQTPEPATVTLLVIGGLALLKRRRYGADYHEQKQNRTTKKCI